MGNLDALRDWGHGQSASQIYRAPADGYSSRLCRGHVADITAVRQWKGSRTSANSFIRSVMKRMILSWLVTRLIRYESS